MLKIEEIRKRLFQIDKKDFPSGKMMAAIAVIGKTSWMGNNNRKSHPLMFQKFANGQESACCHAEASALLKVPKKCRSQVEIYVIRFLRNGNLTCAKPCEMCQDFLKKYNVKNVYYTNWDGKWNKMRLR